PVTDFPHVRRELTDAYVRLVAMKMFSDRALDYFRSAGPDDRRYLLFNPMTKMKVTTEGERVIDLMWDVIAAKGFEADTYFDKAAKDIRGLPKLEGTVHVNLALILKFMPNYLFRPAEYPPVPTRHDPADDEFLFRQGPARGLGAIRFHDWRLAYDQHAHLPNVARFREQADGLVVVLREHAPDAAQQRDLDFLLALGQLFALVVYGQLILEQADLASVDDTVLDEIFDVLVRDFSQYCTELHGKTATTEAQATWTLAHVRRPVPDDARTADVWNRVVALCGAYEMRP
ncbi:MAG: acyl-CoA dehydrogenase, partial [Actinoplanes sp.]|nr:acyl-CoA dehydrogenase [Actinoplanes sp.]